MMPAALTSVVMPPNRCTAAETILAGASGSVTSAANAAARPPWLSISAATS
jgi:hypothetical protein